VNTFLTPTVLKLVNGQKVYNKIEKCETQPRDLKRHYSISWTNSSEM